MNSTGQIGEKTGAGFDETLHLVTHAPVPDGLEERVHGTLETVPRKAQILEWPGTFGWMRAAAAAVIMAVVAGGGWGVYRHVQSHEPAKVNVTPAPQVTGSAAGGFSSAGAIRTPQTVKGPAAVATAKPKSAKKHRIKGAGPSQTGANSIQSASGSAK